jgi:hypothetical protein
MDSSCSFVRIPSFLNGGGRSRTLIRVINRAGSEHLVYALVAEDIDFRVLGLSEMMREIINGMNAVSLRQAGGVYFVPSSERDSLLRLRQLITDIPQVTGLDPFVCALDVPNAVEAKRGLSKAIHAGLLDEINSLRGDLGRLSESGDRLREKTIAQRLVIYKQLKAKAEMYQDLLGMR